MLINLRNALMAGKRLPYDAEAEYLESSGTQYVDTLVNADSNLSVEITMANAGTPSTNVSPGGAILVTPLCRHHLTFDSVIAYWLGNGNNCNVISGYRPTDGEIFTFKVDAASKTFTLGSFLGTFPNDTFDTGLSYWLFGRNGMTPPYLGSLRIYSAKLWNGNTLVRDFIPVRKGTVGYLYDRVSGKLFGNAGTGDFVLGQDVVPVEYLQSKGTQWIDTGTPTADKYIFECLFTDATTDIKLFGNSYAYGRYRDLSIYNSRYRGTSIGTSSNEWDRIEIDVAQPRLTVTRSGSTVGSATSWWSSYTGANPDTQYGTALPFGGHINAHGTWYGTNRVTCFYVAQGVGLRTRLFESWLGSELIEKLLPVRVGTEGAMMDVLTRRVYRNAGTGAFSYGNDLRYPIPAE